MPDGVDVVGVGVGVSSGWGPEAAVLRGESHSGKRGAVRRSGLPRWIVANSVGVEGRPSPLVGFKVGSRSVRGRAVTLGLRLSGPVTPRACDFQTEFAGWKSKSVSRFQSERNSKDVAEKSSNWFSKDEVCE